MWRQRTSYGARNGPCGRGRGCLPPTRHTTYSTTQDLSHRRSSPARMHQPHFSYQNHSRFMQGCVPGQHHLGQGQGQGQSQCLSKPRPRPVLFKAKASARTKAKAKANAMTKAKARNFRGQGQFCEGPHPGTLTGSMPKVIS